VLIARQPGRDKTFCKGHALLVACTRLLVLQLRALPPPSATDPKTGQPPARARRRVCALDLGAARVGVALSDELGLMAHPRGVIAARPRPKLLEALRDLVTAEDVERIVVGFPLDMRGTEGEAARRARALAQEIADATACDVELFDERLTTVQAQRALTASEVRGQKARERIDEASAVEILQAWLDARAARKKRGRK
jgi:putative Holliday junction resolvase